MKKLLSICLLSVLLTMMSFLTAQAQSGNPACCFWVENMQPVTAHHIANLNGTGIAKDTSSTDDLILNNVLNRAVVGNTDVYTLHFPQGANCGQKVSIEWLVYRDGQLVNGNLSDYAELSIFTRYAQLNASGQCQNIDWLGGVVENGDGICGCSVACNDNNLYPPCDNVDGHNDFPGARIANELTPPFHDMDHLAAGYTNIYSYHFNYFYLRFLASAQSSTQIRIKWRQVGNYSLVVRIRERIGGNDFDFTMDGSQNPDMNIGGHMACCGDVLYQDSLHYLVTTNHEKSICEDNPPFPYGQGLAWGANDSTLYDFYPADSTSDLYYVLFGTYTCNHWVVDSIDTFQLYARINPDIVAKDTILCRGDHFTAEDMNNLVTEVNLDAPGIIGHQIEWSLNGDAFSTDPLNVSSVTDLAGVNTFYVRQRNFYFDALDNDTIGCPGDIDTITVTVRDLFPPVLENDHALMFCNETLEENSPLALIAHIDTLRDHCATEIRWYTGLRPGHAAANYVGTGDTLNVDLTQINPTNSGKTVTYYLYTVNTTTDPVTFSDTFDNVSIRFLQTPVFTVDTTTQLDFTVCPGSDVNLLSQVTCTVPNYNDSLPKLTFAWYKDSTLLSNDTNYTLTASTVCNHKDTFTVKITAVSWSYGCTAEMTRTYTVLSQDTVKPVIAWVDTVGTFDTLGNRLVTLSGCDSAAVPAPYTVAQFLAMTAATDTASTANATSRAYIGTIIDGCSNVDSLTVKDVVTSQNACQTIVTRTYVGVDACDNHSNTITEIFTINNDYKPVIAGRVDVNPVRDTSCTYDVPSYAALFNTFADTNNIKVTYQCTKSAFDTVVFYMNNTNVVADGNLNIFADTDLVTIYAVVTDTCGNQSVKTPVFDIHKPAAMYIAHGAITLDTLELCANVTTNMHFNDNFVMNADRPYTYQWSQISVVGQSIITPDSNNYLEAVVSPAADTINTSSHFVMTVVDSLGCVASDTSNAIHFYRLPTAQIISNPANNGSPIYSGDTLCPNYGLFYLQVGPQSQSNLPDSIERVHPGLGYTWSGADNENNKHVDYAWYAMQCENCDSLYRTYLTVTNWKNCSASDTFDIYGVVKTLPQITAIDTFKVRNIEPNSECKIKVPNFVNNNLYFNPITVHDDCFRLSEMTLSQDVKADTLINHDTTVVVTIKAPCWTVHHNIEVIMPDNTINIDSITASKVGCEPLENVVLTPHISDSVGTPTYNWSTGAHTDNIVVTLHDTAHTFTLSVIDQAGCQSNMTVSPIVYRKPLATDFEFVSTPNTHCDNNYDGTFTINVLNDTTAEIAGFTYAGVDYTLPDTVTGVVNGTLTFAIFTDHNCTANFTDSVDLDTSDVKFYATVLHHNNKCVQPYAGSVQVVPQIENYEYRIIGHNQGQVGNPQIGEANVITPLMFNWLYQDTYHVNILTAKGCHYVSDTVVVNDIRETPDTVLVLYDSADCVLNNGAVYVMRSNPTYTYTLNGITTVGNGGTLSFTGLGAGTYMIYVASSGLCQYQQLLDVPAFNRPALPTLSIAADSACTGGTASGTITIAAANVNAGYTYKLYSTNGTETLIDSVVGVAGTSIVFDTLMDGTYKIHITDDHHCSAGYDTVVPNKVFNVPAFTYVKTPGHDCATKKDNKIQINNPDATYDYVLYQKDVFGINNIVDTFPTNGILDSVAKGTQYFIRKIHKLTQCYLDSTLFNLDIVKPTYTFAVSHTNDQDCSDAGTGTITVKNPNSAYTYYLFDYSTTTFNPAYSDTTGTVFTELNSGNYTIFAYNNTTHCSYDLHQAIVDSTYLPEVDTAITTPNYMCKPEKNGTITIVLDSAVSGSYYLADSFTNVWQYGYGTRREYNNIDTNTSGHFTGLNSGRYYVNFVSDFHCQTGYGYVDVQDSTSFDTIFEVTPNFSCAPTINQPGMGCISVISPRNSDTYHGYQYFLHRTDHSLQELDTTYKWCTFAEGTYHIQILDTITGCSVEADIFVPDSVVHVTLDVNKTPNSICSGTGNGKLSVVATADNLDSYLFFSIDNGATWHVTGDTIYNLTDGDYVIMVRDSFFHCLHSDLPGKNVHIDRVEKELKIDYTKVDNTACTNPNGSITINSVLYAADNTPVAYDSTITGGAWTGLNGGTYTITITDTITGCDSTFEVQIITDPNDPCVPVISINSTGHNDHGNYYFCYSDTTGKLTATATGACDADFTYEWSSVCAHASSNTNVVDVYTAETFCCWYYVVATGTTSGCSQVDSFYVCVDTLPVIHFLSQAPLTLVSGSLTPMAGDPTRPTPNFKVCEDQDFTFGIQNPGFDSIVWSNGYVDDQNHATFDVAANTLTPDPDAPVSYCVWVEDHNGCSAGFTAANVYALTAPRMTVPVDSCDRFRYMTQGGIYIDSSYNANVSYPFTVVDTFAAVDGCDSVVTYQVTINAIPVIDGTPSTLQIDKVFCHGDIEPSLFSIAFKNVEDTKQGCYISAEASTTPPVTITKNSFESDNAFDTTAAITRAMNNHVVYAVAYNDCDTIFHVFGKLVVDSLPEVPAITGTPNFCGGTLITTKLTAPAITWNSSGTTSTAWLQSANADMSDSSVISTVYTMHNNHYVSYYAHNHCGTTLSEKVQLSVDTVEPPVLTPNVLVYCAKDSIHSTDLTLTHSSTPTGSITYQLGGADYAFGTPLTFADSGKTFVANVTYACGVAASNTIEIRVDTVILEAIPASLTQTICNGGSISAINYNSNKEVAISSELTTAGLSLNAATKQITGSINIASTETFPKVITGHLYTTSSTTCKNDTLDVTITINDTAKMVVNGDIDTICIHEAVNYFTYTIDTNSTNVVTITPTNATFEKTGASVKVTPIAVGAVSVEFKSEGVGGCGTKTVTKTLTAWDTVSFTSTVADVTICNGSKLAPVPTAPTYTPTENVHSEGWMIGTETVANLGDRVFTLADNGKKLKYYVENTCGTNYSNEATITVNDTAKMVVTGDVDTVCIHEAVNYYTYTIDTNATNIVTITPTNATIEKTGASVKVTPIAVGAVSVEFKSEGVGGCGIKTVTKSFAAWDTVTFTSTVADVTVCNDQKLATAPTAPTFTPTINVHSEGWMIGTETVADLANRVFTTADNGKKLKYYVENTCGTNYSNEATITVIDKPTVTLTKPDTVCVGNAISSTPTVVPNGSAITAEGYQVDPGGAAWSNDANVALADNHTKIYYYATNECGPNSSDTFELHVAGHATIAGIELRDTCSGSPLKDFIKVYPTVTPATDATIVADTTWYTVVGSVYTAIDTNTAVTNPTKIACMVKTQCFTDTSAVMDLTFDGAPVITPATLTVDPICEGDLFKVPTFTVADNGGLITDTLWFINGTTLDFTSIYDAATYNGKEIKLIVNNACGADTANGTATINVRPVPFMLADTVLCADPLNEFTLDVPNGPFVTYAWKDENGDPVSSNKTETIQLNTLAVDTVLKYYVVVKDANGCESESRINRSTYVSDVIPQDTIFTDFIHVRVTTKPFFKFTNMAGVPTHDINSTLSNETTAFKWTLDDKCYGVTDQKVYVKFSIYHNGVLIPETEISDYLYTATTTVGMTSYNWNTNQVVQYMAGPQQTAYSFYEHISNNFPNFYISSYKYDWVYLPFLSSRYITNTFAKFKQEGNYEIHFDLYATNGDQFGNVYDDYPAGATDIIGGHGITSSTLLASDVFTIHVNDGSTVAENEAPEFPEPAVISEDPTVKVYPNPTSTNVNVRIEGIEGQTTIRISTLTGKTVAQRNVNIDNKFAVEQFNVSDLTPGVYVLQIVNEEAVISRKLVITK